MTTPSKDREAVHYGGTWTLIRRSGRWEIAEIPVAGWRADRDAAERLLKRLVDSGEAITLLEEAEEATSAARAVTCDQCREAPPVTRAPTGRGLWCLECVGAVESNTNNYSEEEMDAQEIRARLEGVPMKNGRLYTDAYKIAVADLAEEAAADGVTQSEIGDALGLSQAEVSRLKRSGVKLKRWQELTPAPMPLPNGDTPKSDELERLRGELEEVQGFLEEEVDAREAAEDREAEAGEWAVAAMTRCYVLEQNLACLIAQMGEKRQVRPDQGLDSFRVALSQIIDPYRGVAAADDELLQEFRGMEASLERASGDAAVLRHGLHKRVTHPDPATLGNLELLDLLDEQSGVRKLRALRSTLDELLGCTREGCGSEVEIDAAIIGGVSDLLVECEQRSERINELASINAQLRTEGLDGAADKIKALLDLIHAERRVIRDTGRTERAEKRFRSALAVLKIGEAVDVEPLFDQMESERSRLRNAEDALEAATAACVALGLEV